MNSLFPVEIIERPLYDFQARGLEMLRQSIGGDKLLRPVLQIPTGGGKTRTAAEIIKRALKKGNQAIFVVPRISLIEQTVKSFAGEGIDDIGVIQGQNYRTRRDAAVQIASAQTLARRDIPQAGIVLIDECHLRMKALETWMDSEEWAKVPFVGLSATPWARGMGDHWNNLLKPTSIAELIARTERGEPGGLLPFKIKCPPVPEGADKIRTGNDGDFREDDLSEVYDQREIVANVIETWLKEAPGEATLVYGVDCAHAKHLQERFVAEGVTAEYIDANTPLYDREEIFRRSRNREVDVICNVATCDTGIDLPHISCLIDARQTKSKIRFVQTIGRLLRTFPGLEYGLILDHAGNHNRFKCTVAEMDCARLHSGKSEAKSYDKAPPDEKAPSKLKTCSECHFALPPRVTVCPECGAEQKALTDVVERPGELVNFGDKKSKAKQLHLIDDSRTNKQLWWSGILGYAAAKGKSSGWASHTYKAKFGVWPRSLADIPCDPPPEVLGLIRHRAIAWANGKEKSTKLG